jgi:hypothetical protein
MVRDPPLVLIIIGIIFNVFFFSTTNNYLDQKVYGHIFSTDETASFVAFADQLQIESELVHTNLANNNVSLAQKHANKAASLLTPSIMIEIAEESQKIADELTTAVNGLQKISSSSSEKQLQNVNQLVSDINATLGEAVSIRIEQRQGEDSSNFLEKGIEFLRGIFGGGGNEEVEDKGNRDITIQPLAFADLVDSVLINYGNAYAVGFDMTNMSNMAMMGGNSSGMTMDDMAKDDDNNNTNADMNMGSMNMSSHTTMNMESETNGNYSLVDIVDYQSAQALAAKALEIFNVELKPMASNNNTTTAFIANLENGLTQLNNSIRKKAPPIDIMMIVHTQVHPNLLEGFNLQLR